MKSAPWLFIAAVVAMSSAGRMAAGQQCSVSYSPDFSVYANEASDGTNIYTYVDLDSSGIMTLDGQCYNLPEIYHTAMLWNSVGTSSSGWVPFGQFCPDCYVSAEQDEEMPDASPGVDYVFDYEGQMWCNIGGLFYDLSGSFTLRIAVSTLQYQSVSGGQCTYTLSSTNGNQNATCASGPLVTPAPCPYEYFVTDFLAVKWGAGNKACFGIGTGGYTNTPAPCQ